MSSAGDLPDIRALRPESYVTRERLWSGEPVLAFTAEAAEDFDWLERMILDNGYYEHEGVWSLDLDQDKRAMAEILAAFRPRQALEIGCSIGAVLQCLKDLDVHGEGVEISRMAIERALPDVRDRIHHGDLLTLDLAGTFDLVFGLDVFEHLNPNRLEAYLARTTALLGPGSYLLVNAPAFGDDPVFGLVFPVYLRDWYQDLSLERPFRVLHCDAKGYPVNGHLIWADSLWWVRQFERHGLRREESIERAIHARYDHFFDTYAPARKTLYVFSKGAMAAESDAIVECVLSSPSAFLGAPHALCPPVALAERDGWGTHLLRSTRVFFAGWHGLEVGPHGPFRWSRGRAYMRLTGASGRRLHMRVFTHDPDVARGLVTVRFQDPTSGARLARVSLGSRDPVPVQIELPTDDVVIEVAVDPTWVPAATLDANRDLRELGIGMCDVQLGQPGEPEEPARRRQWPGPAGIVARLRRAVRGVLSPIGRGW